MVGVIERILHPCGKLEASIRCLVLMATYIMIPFIITMRQKTMKHIRTRKIVTNCLVFLCEAFAAIGIWRIVIAPLGSILYVKLRLPLNWTGNVSLVAFWLWLIIAFFEIHTMKRRCSIKGRLFEGGGNNAADNECDSPIRLQEQDKLGRKGLVIRIADKIDNAHVQCDALFMGIFAPWGDGKTSLMNMVQDEMRFNRNRDWRKMIFVNFNTRQFIKAEDALISLTRLISEALIREGLDSVAMAFRNYGHLLSLRRMNVSCSSYIGEILDVIRQVFFSFYYKEESVVSNIQSALSTMDAKIVIIVDDLERLPYRDSFRIIRFLKANFDLPNVIVVILSDKRHLQESVAQGVATESSSTMSKYDASLYLEKLVPLHFDLPKIDSAILLDYIKESISDMLNGDAYLHFNPADKEDFDNEIVGYYVRNMRDAKRLLSKLDSNLIFHRQLANANEINVHIGDLIVITILQIWEGELYRDLPSFVRGILSTRQCMFPSWGLEEIEFNNYISNYITDVNDASIKNEKERILRRILTDRLRIVPKSVSDKTFYILEGLDNPHLDSERRLASLNYFYLYYDKFERSRFIPLTIIKTIEKCVREGSIPCELLQEMIKKHSLPTLLDELRTHRQFANQMEDKQYFRILIWLANQAFDQSYFDYGDKNVVGETIPIAKNIYLSIFYCITNYCLQYQSPGDVPIKGIPVRIGGAQPWAGGNLLFETLQETSSPHILCSLLDFERCWHVPNVSKADQAIRLLSDDQFTKLSEMVVVGLEEYQNEDKLFASHNGFALIQAWIDALQKINVKSRWMKAKSLLSKSLRNLDNVETLLYAISLGKNQHYSYTEAENGIVGFDGINVEFAIKLIGVTALRKINLQTQDRQGSCCFMALSYIVENNFEADKCAPEKQVAFIRMKLDKIQRLV